MLPVDFKGFPHLKQKIIAFCVKFIDKRCNIILFQSSFDKTTIILKLKTE